MGTVLRATTRFAFSVDGASAASIARTFPTTVRLLAGLGSPNSASASCRAEVVRFSICELDALSDRSRIAAIGAKVASPVPRHRSAYESKSMRAEVASSSSAASSPVMRGYQSESLIGMIDSYSPV